MNMSLYPTNKMESWLSKNDSGGCSRVVIEVVPTVSGCARGKYEAIV